MNTEVPSTTQINQLIKLAEQFHSQGDTSKAARFYQMAGEKAFAAYQNDEAITYLSTSLTLTPDAQVETRYTLLFALEQVYALVRQNDARKQNLTSLATLADILDSDQKRAEVAARLSLYKLDNGENEDVISISRLATRIAQMANAVTAVVDLHLIWGRALLRLGQPSQAESKFQHALAQAQEHNLLAQEAASTRYLGVRQEEKGDYKAAKALYKQALALYEHLNDQRGNSDMLNNLGKVSYDQGLYTAAMRFWDHAKPNYLAIGDKSGLCRLLINQSAISLNLGDYAKAQSYSQEALTLSQEINLKFGEALAFINISLAGQYQGQLDAAVESAQQALALATTMGNKRLQGYAHNTLGRALVAQEMRTEANEQFWQALAIWHELDQATHRAEAEAGLIDIALSQANVAEAQSHLTTLLPALLSGETFEGAESPFYIYWHAYQALKASNNAKASEILGIAHRLLQERAEKIVDAPVRKQFLEQVAVHRLLVTAFSNNND